MPEHRVSEQKRSFAKRLRREQTSPEVLLWHELRNRRLDGWKFRRQVPIEGYVVDFVCFDARLIVEIDGPLHHEADHRMRDLQRDTALRRNGFVVLRFSADVGAGRMIEGIRQALTTPPHPAPD